MMPAWVLGAGGHAKVVIDTLRAAGEFEVRGLLDDDRSLRDARVLGVPVLGPLTIATLDHHGVERAILAIGSNRARARLAAAFEGRLRWITGVHPTACIAPGVHLGEGALVAAGAILQPDATVGRHAILNTGCRVDHDCRIRDFAHVGPAACLAGEVEVGDGALLGVGCSVIPGRRVGAWSVVGAGSVVVSDVAVGETVIGVPARPKPCSPPGLV